MNAPKLREQLLASYEERIRKLGIYSFAEEYCYFLKLKINHFLSIDDMEKAGQAVEELEGFFEIAMGN